MATVVFTKKNHLHVFTTYLYIANVGGPSVSSILNGHTHSICRAHDIHGSQTHQTGMPLLTIQTRSSHRPLLGSWVVAAFLFHREMDEGSREETLCLTAHPSHLRRLKQGLAAFARAGTRVFGFVCPIGAIVISVLFGSS